LFLLDGQDHLKKERELIMKIKRKKERERDKEKKEDQNHLIPIES